MKAKDKIVSDEKLEEMAIRDFEGHYDIHAVVEGAKWMRDKQCIAPNKAIEGLKSELLERVELQSYIENKRFEDDEDVLVVEVGRINKITKELFNQFIKETK